MRTIRITVRPDESRTSLLDFLALRLHISKKRAKNLLNARNVFVNRKRVWMARHSLTQNDTVEIPETSDFTTATGPFTILFEDDDYLVVNKKPGILSNGIDSIETRLRVQTGMPSLVIAHRLDKDTSGCLLLAKNTAAYEYAVSLFRRHRVTKTYHVITAGRVQSKTQTIMTPLEGRRAVTRVITLDSNRDASHLLVRIETGRTHQIRKHLAIAHHPVMGDRYYGTRFKARRKSMTVGRQMLHASKLEFKHQATGRKILGKAPLPHDFRKCLQLYRLT